MRVPRRESGEVWEDRLTGKSSIYMPGRIHMARQPRSYLTVNEVLPIVEMCPFCPGGEADEGKLLAQLYVEGEWQSRSVANRWPQRLEDDKVHHEVVLLSREHNVHLGTMSAQQAHWAMEMLINRVRAVSEQGDKPNVFLNHGVDAGASQPHPHAHVLGLPKSAPLLRREASVCEGDTCEVCLQASMEELRVLGDKLVAWCPAAQVRTFEMRFGPVEHEQWPEDTKSVGRMVRDAVRALVGVEDGAYNIGLCMGPDMPHWHGHLIPRNGRWGGQEVLSGMGGTLVEVHEAVKRLRAAL